MDRDTYKPQVSESLVTDEIILDSASTALTASLQNELSSKVRSDLGVTGHQVNNVCKCEHFPENIRQNSLDHQEDIKQNTSIPAVKQEIIDIFPNKEITEDVFKEEIHDKRIKGEIQEYIKLADAANCPQLRTVRTDSQPVVINNEMAEDLAQEDFEGPMNSGKLGMDEEIGKVKIEKGSIEPTLNDKSNLLGTDPHKENVCKYEHQEDIKQDTSIPAVKPEMMDIVIKKEETDVVFKEEIYDDQIIKDEILDCKEYIKLEDGMNCSCVVKTESQRVVMKNELSEEDGLQEKRINGASGDEKRFSKRVRKTRILPEAVKVTSSDEGSDFGESRFLSSGKESDHKDDNRCLKPKGQRHRNKKRRKILRSKDVEEYVPRKGDSWHGNTNKSGKNFCRDANKICHSADRPHQCEVCGKHLKTSITLRNHLHLHSARVKSSHQKVKPFSCADCGKSFPYLSNLKQHQLFHSGKKLFSCTDCGKSFSQLGDLKNHQLLHTGKKLFTCEICDKSFAQPGGLHSHMRSHQEVKRFSCADCGKSFFYLSKLKKHQLVHSGKKPFSCADCGKCFSRLGNLKNHQLLHTGKKLFTCEICDKTFAQPAGLHSHMRSHQEVKQFSCADCGKSFTYLSNLKKHQLVHSGKKLFSCSECGKSFSQLGNLKTHQLLHTDKKLFACEVCDKAFAQPAGLQSHMKTHQAVKSFTCTDCKKSFSQLSNLKTHQLLHTGKKLFACDICDKSFAQPRGLQSHMTIHQAVKTFSCADCGKSFSRLSHLKTHHLLHRGKKLFTM